MRAVGAFLLFFPLRLRPVSTLLWIPMDTFTTEFIKLVFAIATPVILVYVGKVIMALNAKYHLGIDAEKQAKLETFARLGIQSAEEWAAKQAAAKIPAPSQDKLTHAVQFVLDKVPGVTPQEAADLIHAKLPEMGLGASADFLQALRSKVEG